MTVSRKPYWLAPLLVGTMAFIFLPSLARSAETKKTTAQTASDLDKALTEMRSYRFGESRLPLTTVSDHVRQIATNPKERKAFATELAKILTSADATKDCKRFICRQLSLIGSDESVPALATLLTDKDLSHMARYALERIPTPSAAKALRDAIPRLKGELLVGVINSLGVRRDKASTAILIQLLNDKDTAVAAAAACALAKIGGMDAAKALQGALSKAPKKLQPTLQDACLLVADGLLKSGQKEAASAIYERLYGKTFPTHVRIAALRGLVAARGAEAVPLVIALLTGPDPTLQAAATRFVREIPGEQTTKAFAAMLPKLSSDGQVLLLSALADRGDRAALPEVMKALNSKDTKVVTAATRALGVLGDISTVPTLAKLATSSQAEVRNAAMQSLSKLRGANIDAAIVKTIQRSSDAKTRIALIGVLATRNVTTATPDLLDMAAKDKDAKVREATLSALSKLAGADDLPALVRLLIKAKNKRERSAAEKAVIAVCGRIEDPDKRSAPILAALEKSSGDTRCALLRVLGKIGGEKSLAAVCKALKDKAPNVQDAAVRALCDWPDATAAPALLDLAKNAKNPVYRVLALRGYVRVVGLPSNRSAAETIRMYEDGMKAAFRTEEKKLVLSGLATVKDTAAFDAVLKYLDDPALRAEAAAAVAKIAEEVGLEHRKEAKAALATVLAKCKEPAIRDQAKAAIKAIEIYDDYIETWLFAGPYTQNNKSNKELFSIAFPPEDPKAQNVKYRIVKAGVTPSKPWLVELDKIIGGSNCVGYLKTWVWSPEDQKARLELGSDDGFKAWLNGKLVMSENVDRGVAPNQNSCEVQLKKGWNELMLKVTQGGGQWAACARFRTPEGNHIDNLLYFGTNEAFQQARADIRSSNATERTTALYLLTIWPDRTTAYDLLRVAEKSHDKKLSGLALDAFLKAVRRVQGLPPDDILDMCDRALKIVKTKEQRRAVFDIAVNLKCLQSSYFLQKQLTRPDAAADASLALLDLAKAIAPAYPDAAKAAIRKALAVHSADEVLLEKKAAAARKIAEEYDDYLRKWEVAGPYTAQGKTAKDLFSIAFTPETNPKSATWKPVRAGENMNLPYAVDLNKLFEKENAAAYLRTRVWSPEKRDVLLLVGSDDGVKVWLNGKVVYEQNVERPLKRDEDSINVTLRKGWNDLLVKVTQAGGDWAFSARFRGTDGSKLLDLRINK